MVIVLGQPRTGTSWVMQILKYLGLNVFGSQYRVDINKKFNIFGFWEDPEWLSGNKDPSIFGNNHAVKINLRCAVENELNFDSSKVIVCDRNRVESANSQIKTFSTSSIQRICNHDDKWYNKFYSLSINHLLIKYCMSEKNKRELIEEYI